LFRRSLSRRSFVFASGDAVAVDGSHANELAPHGGNNPPRLRPFTLPALPRSRPPAHSPRPPAPLALPALEEDLPPFHGREAPGEVLVETAILEGHHDQELDAPRRRPQPRRGQHGRHVAGTDSKRVRGVSRGAGAPREG